MERRTDGDPRALTRRRLLGGVAVALTGGSVGCLGSPTDGTGESPTTETGSPSTTNADGTAREGTPTTATRRGTTDGDTSTDQPQVASVSVSDFIEYALAGVHPHVHNRTNVQYVVVGVRAFSTAIEPRAVRARLGLSLDGSTRERATKQPFPWQRELIDVAFAVPKDERFEAGAVRFGGEDVRSLSAATIDRLNAPPVFSVSELTVTPSEIDAGERTTATVRFTVANTGDGAGTFGASVQGNYASGATTVTAALEPGETRELTQSVEIIGREETVAVTVDWGISERRLTVPVVGSTPTATVKTETRTPTPN